MKTRLALPFLIAALTLTACAPEHRNNNEPSRKEIADNTQAEVLDDGEGLAPSQTITIDDGVDKEGTTQDTREDGMEDNDVNLLDDTKTEAATGAKPGAKPGATASPTPSPSAAAKGAAQASPTAGETEFSDAGETVVIEENQNDSADQVASNDEAEEQSSEDAALEASQASDDSQSTEETDEAQVAANEDESGANEEVAPSEDEDGSIIADDSLDNADEEQILDDAEMMAAKKGGKPAPKKAAPKKATPKKAVAAKPAAKGKKPTAKPAPKKAVAAKPPKPSAKPKKAAAKPAAGKGKKAVAKPAPQKGKRVAAKPGKKPAPKKVAKPAPSMDRSRITVGSIAASSAAPRQNEARKFAPASITKLATTGMALEYLGHNFTFRHKLAWRGVRGSANSITNLTWLGEGDPTIGHPKFEADGAGMGTLKKMASALKAKGIKSVQGTITLRAADPRMNNWFVAAGVPNWEPFTCYGAPPRVFNIFANCSPGSKLGRPALRDPQTRAKQALVAALKSVGISVNEGAKPAANPPVASILFRTASMPKLLYWMNKRSDNLIAESLFKAVAKTQPGANLQQNGQAIYRRSMSTWLSQIGAGGLIGELNFLDGSGLTPNNVVTPRAFLQMLKRYIPKNYFADLWQSLPIAGVDGTLMNRAKNPIIRGKVRAKTGTLTGYYQLAGYIPRLASDNKTVKELVPFVILTQAPGSKTWARAARSYQDEVLVNLARKVNAK